MNLDRLDYEALIDGGFLRSLFLSALVIHQLHLVSWTDYLDISHR
jgi:hypothetical protein